MSKCERCGVDKRKEHETRLDAVLISAEISDFLRGKLYDIGQVIEHDNDVFTIKRKIKDILKQEIRAVCLK